MGDVALPAWPGEDFDCPECGMSFRATTPSDAVRSVLALPERISAVLLATPAELTIRRIHPTTWSILEYVCHLRDVYVASTIRVFRAQHEEGPLVDPMLNDLRAARFKYNDRSPWAVVDELGAATAGFCTEVGRVPDDGWDRPVRRLPGEERSTLWLVRAAMHEGVHHVADIRRLVDSPRPA